MTSHSQVSARAFESRDLTLALLASRLSEVSQQLGGLATRVEAAEAAIEDVDAVAGALTRMPHGSPWLSVHARPGWVLAPGRSGLAAAGRLW